MNGLTLYSFRRCPFAMRVRFTLHEKGIPFSIKEEDLKNFSPELRSLHPEAKVPVLVYANQVLYESAIITEFLEEAFPEPALLPADPGLRAQARLWTYWCNQIFKRDVDRLKYGESRFTAAEIEGVQGRMQGHLTKLEDRLTGHDWLVGQAFSLADIHIFPFVRQLLHAKPPGLAPTPRLLAWTERVGSRPAFLETLKA